MTKKLSVPQRLAAKMIGLYQSWSRTRPGVCRFTPSCSEYTNEAIQIHGFFKGSFFGLKRLLKCHPLGSWGYDPPPPAAVSSTVSSASSDNSSPGNLLSTDSSPAAVLSANPAEAVVKLASQTKK